MLTTVLISVGISTGIALGADGLEHYAHYRLSHAAERNQKIIERCDKKAAKKADKASKKQAKKAEKEAEVEKVEAEVVVEEEKKEEAPKTEEATQQQ